MNKPDGFVHKLHRHALKHTTRVETLYVIHHMATGQIGASEQEGNK
jgi:hypothetical protein